MSWGSPHDSFCGGMGGREEAGGDPGGPVSERGHVQLSDGFRFSRCLGFLSFLGFLGFCGNLKVVNSIRFFYLL